MGLRPFTRDQAWLLPPALSDLIPQDHPVRMAAAFVESLDAVTWAALGVDDVRGTGGAPAYHPQALVGAWVYGFMTGIRSSRKLEAACRDQLPFLWLVGGAPPDHNTLWRFYKQHRHRMRTLLKRTVRVAIRLGLIDWAVQAVDGTKIAGNAARERSYDAAALAKLLVRTEKAIADLEAQNAGGDDPPPPKLPKALAKAQALRKQVEQALTEGDAAEHAVNLTDGEARLMKSRHGIVAGYNGQVMVSPLTEEAGHGMLITAAELTQAPHDQGQLLTVIHAAASATGKAPLTLADAGYLSGPALDACGAAKIRVAIPDGHLHPDTPYHRDRFTYDADTESFTCPEGQQLRFSHIKHRTGEGPVWVYRNSGRVCRACPAFGQCTKSKRQGRSLEVTEHDAALQAHHAWMQTAEAQAAYALRKCLVEPSFGIMKEQQRAGRFLLRGTENVGDEWSLLGTAFNLRSLWRVLRHQGRCRSAATLLAA